MAQEAIAGLVLVAWFVVLAGLEFASPVAAVSTQVNPSSRLITNFGLGIAMMVANGVSPIARVGASQLVGRLDVGIARQFALPWLATAILLFLADSFAGYWTHRLMHSSPVLWRVHRVHHADRALDLSTGLRTHPFELVVTLPVSVAVVVVIGAPASAILVVQTIAFAAALWQHADIELPPSWSALLNRFILTPALHRLHHSRDRALHDTNYGELLTLWDQLFGTFARARPGIQIGLAGQRARSDRLVEQIWAPLGQ